MEQQPLLAFFEIIIWLNFGSNNPLALPKLKISVVTCLKFAFALKIATLRVFISAENCAT